MEPRHYDLRLAQRILIPHLEERGIPYLDLEPPLRVLAEREELYLPMDGHWNDAGTDAAARAIYDWLAPMVGSVAAPYASHAEPATP